MALRFLEYLGMPVKLHGKRYVAETALAKDAPLCICVFGACMLAIVMSDFVSDHFYLMGILLKTSVQS